MALAEFVMSHVFCRGVGSPHKSVRLNFKAYHIANLHKAELKAESQSWSNRQVNVQIKKFGIIHSYTLALRIWRYFYSRIPNSWILFLVPTNAQRKITKGWRKWGNSTEMPRQKISIASEL
jgi:hypothetical protein